MGEFNACLVPATSNPNLFCMPAMPANCLTLGHCPAVQCQGSVTTLTYACLFASMYCAHCLCVTYIGIVCGHLVKPPPPMMGDFYCTHPAHGIQPSRTLPSVLGLGLVLVFGLGLGVMLTWKNRPHDMSNLRVDLLSWHRHPRRAPCSLTP